MIIIYILILISLLVLYFYIPVDDDNDDDICDVTDEPEDRAVFLKKPPFKSGETVYVYIEDVFNNPNGEFKKFITDIINKDIRPFVNLNFVIVDEPKPYAKSKISITNDDSSMKSKSSNGVTIGMGTSSPLIAIRNAKPRTVIHEFGHALGLAHEMSHPKGSGKLDLDAIVDTWMSRNPGVDRATATDNVIRQNFKKLDSNEYGYSPIFDKDSVMLYNYAANKTTDGVKIVGGDTFSTMDKAQLKKMYQ